MTSAADTLKTILNAYNWATDAEYTTTPAIAILYEDDLTKYREDKAMITLENVSEEPEFTYNEVRLISPQIVELILTETTTALRDAFYNAVKRCFQTSSYSIIYKDVKTPSFLQPFKKKMRIQILL